MFIKGLQSSLNRYKTADTPTTKAPQNIVVCTSQTLLADEKRQAHLRTIKSLLNLPPKLYQSIYFRVIEEFAEFVQSLPETEFGLFNRQGNFLDHALERAARALTLCLSYFFPQQKSFQNANSQQSLWIYAVFTAALLLDIGKIAVKYHITLCNPDGSVIKDWLPYSGSMVKQTKYYQYSFVKQNRDNLRRYITSLLARQILDAASRDTEGGNGGFNWIASNPDVLEAWLIVLSGDTRSIQSFLTVIPLADAQVIESMMLDKQNLGKPASAMMINRLFESPTTAEAASILPTTEAGEAFLQWLRENIANEKIQVNSEESQVNVVNEGVIVDEAIIKKFVEQHKQYDAGSVAQQFKQLMEMYQNPIGDLGSRYARIRGLATIAMERFFLINNVYLLFAMGQVPTISSDIIRLPTTNPVAPPPDITQSQQHNNPHGLLYR